uniref:E3 ubiquitin-protein ligase MARCHF3 n=1 Tax=Bos taurus TaxID=9913 RepID=A0AAA9S9H9_BOVIN
MTTSRCSHLPEVLPDCTGSAAPVVKTVEDCGSLVNGQPQYVMQVSAKDGQLLSTVVRTLATQSPFNDRPMCRICHEGSSQEDLLSPCECTGTLGTIHRSCLEHWLSSSNTSYCELCHFRFAVERKPRPLVEWLRNPGPQHEKRTLFGDMVCFLFITPLATISGWLCLRGAVDHLHFSSRLEAVGLIALTVALFTIYLFWTLAVPFDLCSTVSACEAYGAHTCCLTLYPKPCATSYHPYHADHNPLLTALSSCPALCLLSGVI